VTHVLDLADCSGVPASQIGGKALGLGRLFAQSPAVPPGFVVTAAAYRSWIREHGFDTRIAELLDDIHDDVSALQQAAGAIADLLSGAELHSEQIDRAYRRLGAAGDAAVAVRSSATGEDAADASFAGAQDTHLWVRGASEVRRHIVRCWASLFTPAAVSYRARMGPSGRDTAMAVVVQEMVDATAAGVMFTLDPLTGDPSQITIESTLGLGVSLVGGEVTPDRFCVDKVTFEIRSRTIVDKPFADRLVGPSVQRIAVTSGEAASPSLTDDEVIDLARTARRVERALGVPVDMEWAIGPGPTGPRHVHLLQARPETVWSAARRAPAPPEPPAPATSALSRIAVGMRKNRR
jgi:phosphoenolpyruvate synthase/pyruvate phosphate dikinase